MVLLGFTWRYLGSYMEAIFNGRVHFLGFVERPIYRALGTSPEQEQTWKRYAGAMIVFSAVSFALHVRHLAYPGIPAPQSPAPWSRGTGVELQHGPRHS